MSKSRLSSGRVKKTVGGVVNPDFVDLGNTEPNLGLPSVTGQALVSTTAGVRSWSTLATVATSGSYADLTNKPTIPAAQIPSDWTQASNVALDYIKNKPTIPAAQVQSDWNAITGLGVVLNKPTLFDGAYSSLSGRPTLFSGSYNDLTNKPTISSTLVTLTDVTVTSPANGQSLVYNTATSKWINGAGTAGATTLAGLTDVAVTSPTNSQVLVYNASTSKWINSAISVPYFPLSGATTVYVNQVIPYAINDYDAFTTYSVSATAGSATVAGNTITFTAPATAGNVTLSLSNGTLTRSVIITVLASGITTPTITNPTNNSTVYLGPTTVTFTSTAFGALGAADTHLNSDWQLATDSAFTTVTQSSLASTSNKTTWTLTFLTTATYYVRVRHRGTANGVSAYSSTIQFTVAAAAVATPTVTNPVTGTTNYLIPNITFTTSAFQYLGTFDAHVNTDWQLATDDAFGTVVYSSTASTTNLTAWSVTGLSVLTTYYVRVRHRGSTNGVSAYSSTVNFTTTAEFQAYIATPTATPAAFGDPLEGGFYAGMIWNQATTSSTRFLPQGQVQSTIPSQLAYTTGQKTFIVPDMTAVPIFYVGQTVECRGTMPAAIPGGTGQRPAGSTTIFYGTVASAGSNVLKINVTLVGGTAAGGVISSGGGDYQWDTWSIVARYRVILAPKAQGQSGTDLVWGSTSGAPSASVTLTEGYRSTQALVAAGNSTRYPAAWFCKNLSIAGYSDWYLPARDEIELCYRNLKAGTTSNIQGNRINITDNYATLGAYNDVVNAAHGVNLNSSPPGAAYTNNPNGTTLLPPQTTAANFQLGGTEAWLNNSAFVTSSYTASQDAVWQLGNAAFGTQDLIYYYGARSVRAIRRSPI